MDIIKNLLNKSVVKYLISGGCAFSAEYLLFLVLFYIADIKVAIANVISFCLGLVTSYTLNKLWVFKGEQDKKGHAQIVIYTSLALINLALTTYLVVVLSSLTPESVAKLILMVSVAAWNYVIFKKVIFAGKK